jgi:hypothetical protein
VSAINQQSQTKSFHPALINSTSQQEIGFQPRPPAYTSLVLRRRDHVLHQQWGRGRVLDASFCNGDVTICFDNGQRTVSPNTLRRLLSRTVLAQVIARSTPDVSAWMVRKADEQGTIEPDIKGRFAGHAVHYYDEARIPLLLEQLSRQDSWPIGSMVMHEEYGPGRVARWQSQTSGTRDRMRLVQFFGRASLMAVEIQQLRRLLISSVVANRLGLNRQTFAKLAKRKGVCPDHVISGSRVREFYDEGRIEDIRKRWFVSERMDFFPAGCFVLDGGQLARVEFRDVHGQLHVRYLDSSSPVQPADTPSLRKLVSLRELARGERISRYKLSRLLTAAGVRPVHRGCRVIYFDENEARKAVRDRLGRESSAVSLGALADRTGVSAAVLARKVRQGCISTIRQTTHAVDASEAGRIGEIVRSLYSHTESLKALGICQLHARGRAGEEVAAWNIQQLITVAEALMPVVRARLFGQVAWLCDGSGRRRFVTALEGQILSWYSTGGDDQQRTREAQILLTLLGHLPAEFARYRPRIALVASGAYKVYSGTKELNRHRHARLSPDHSYGPFRADMDASVAELLTRERIHLSVWLVEPLPTRNRFVYPEDDFVQGAVIACMNDGKPEVGLVVRVEQQAWNSVARRWEKTILVRFAQGERRINPYARAKDTQQSNQSVIVLLRAAESNVVLHRMHDCLQAEQGMVSSLAGWKRQAS